MQIAPNVQLVANIDPWILVSLAFTAGYLWLAWTARISKQHAERLIAHLEFVGFIIIGYSVAGTGVLVGDSPLQAQIFKPWPGFVMIFVAYQLKLVVQSNRLNNNTPSLSKSLVVSGQNALSRIRTAFQKRKHE